MIAHATIVLLNGAGADVAPQQYFLPVPSRERTNIADILVKNKTKKLKIGQKTLIYRREGESYWLFCPPKIQFYEFNNDAFAILLCISRRDFNSKLTAKIRKNILVQEFLKYLVENCLVTKKYLKNLCLLTERENYRSVGQ